MYQYVYGNWFTMIAYAYAELDVAGILKLAPHTVDELAGHTRTNPRAMGRFLSCAGALGLHRTNPADGKLVITELGALLADDSPNSLRAAARLNGAPYRYGPWGHLTEYLKTGTGKGLSPTWDQGSLTYLRDKPDLLRIFEAAMTDLGKATYQNVDEDRLIATTVDFGRFDRIMDVGCGNGFLLRAILAANPRLRGALFDLPEVLEDAPSLSPDPRCNPRIVQCPGDFLESIPSGYDAYVVKNVLHNWPRHLCLRLLRNLHQAILGPGATSDVGERRLLLLEMIMPEAGDADLVSKFTDLNLNLLVDGEVRALEDYKQLLAEAGFEILSVQELPGLERKAIEATAVAGTP